MTKIYKATLYLVDVNEQIHSKEDFIKNVEFDFERSYIDGRFELFEASESDEFQWEEDSNINKTNVSIQDFEEYFK